MIRPWTHGEIRCTFRRHRRRRLCILQALASALLCYKLVLPCLTTWASATDWVDSACAHTHTHKHRARAFESSVGPGCRRCQCPCGYGYVIIHTHTQTQQCRRTPRQQHDASPWSSFISSVYHSYLSHHAHATRTGLPSKRLQVRVVPLSSTSGCVMFRGSSNMCTTDSYKRVKGRSHTVEERISMHPHKPHATSQPSRFSHTHSLTAQLAQPLTAPHTHVP